MLCIKRSFHHWPLCWLQVFSPVNNVAINMAHTYYFEIPIFMILCIWPEVELCGTWKCAFSFVEEVEFAFHKGALLFFQERLSAVLCPHQHLLLSVIYLCYFIAALLICMFLIIGGIEYFYIFLLAICVCMFFGKNVYSRLLFLFERAQLDTLNSVLRG